MTLAVVTKKLFQGIVPAVDYPTFVAESHGSFNGVEVDPTFPAGVQPGDTCLLLVRSSAATTANLVGVDISAPKWLPENTPGTGTAPTSGVNLVSKYAAGDPAPVINLSQSGAGLWCMLVYRGGVPFYGADNVGFLNPQASTASPAWTAPTPLTQPNLSVASMYVGSSQAVVGAPDNVWTARATVTDGTRVLYVWDRPYTADPGFWEGGSTSPMRLLRPDGTVVTIAAAAPVATSISLIGAPAKTVFTAAKKTLIRRLSHASAGLGGGSASFWAQPLYWAEDVPILGSTVVPGSIMAFPAVSQPSTVFLEPGESLKAATQYPIRVMAWGSEYA